MHIEDLLKSIDQSNLPPAAKDALRQKLQTGKKYGLVWEDKEEDVEERLLTELPVLLEVPERYIPARAPEAPAGELDLVPATLEAPAPHHVLIEGDNLHALTALSFTHKGRIDVIYIDPPYNTGNKDFKYNDTYVDKEDSYRHSKWLSFMHKRLVLAKELLADTGVIFISIDDNEQAQLKLLCDEVFGEENKAGIMVWQKSKKGDSKQIAVTHEYVIVYSKNKVKNIEQGFWRVKKPGVFEVLEHYQKLRSKFEDHAVVSLEMRKWYKGLPKLDVRRNHKHYNWSDDRGLYFAADFAGPDDGRASRPRYEIIHPITNKPVKKPSTGWRWEEERTIAALNENPARIHFGKDETVIPNRKSYLFEIDSEPFQSVFYRDGRKGTLELESILGKTGLQFPKDWETLRTIINLVPHSSTILDFFAGSGTTLHAVMQLNAEDGGSRQCILVTNNENNIAEEVCYERNKRVINGYTKPNGQAVAGLSYNHLHYFKAEFVPAEKSQANRRRLVEASIGLLQIKDGAFVDETDTLRLARPRLRAFRTEAGAYTLVALPARDMAATLAEAQALAEDPLAEAPVRLYIFWPTDPILPQALGRIELVPLPAAIYEAYRNSFTHLGLERLRKQVPAPLPPTPESSPAQPKTLFN